MNINEVIVKRKSIRSYNPSFNDQNTILEVKKMVEETNNKFGPFRTKINVSIISKNDLGNNVKLGTYGMISGANYYLLASGYQNTNPIDFGYLFEELILKMTALNLGTVWMAGTYNKSDFAKYLNEEDLELKVISPFGFASNNDTFLSKVSKSLISNKRKDFNKIFFNGSNLEKITDNNVIEALNYVRLAPSSMNKQPWRIVVENNTYHFYVSKDTNSNKLDLGICFSHLDLYMQSKERVGSISTLPNEYLDNYVFSVTY